MKNEKINEKDVKKIIEIYNLGERIEKIYKQFGISRQTLYNILKRENIKLRKEKYNISKFCPLFSKTLYHDIYCEGVCDEFKMISLSFKDKNEKYSYIEKYCNGKCFQKCKIYRIMLESL